MYENKRVTGALPDISSEELSFTYQELEQGRANGYHQWGHPHPLASYAVDHPEDICTEIKCSAVTLDQYDSIISCVIEWHISTKNVKKKDIAERMQRDRSTVRDWLRHPSGMEEWAVRVLCDVLEVSLNELVCVLTSDDYEEGTAMSPTKLSLMYAALSDMHRRMISGMVWELYDSERSRREYDNLLSEFTRP